MRGLCGKCYEETRWRISGASCQRHSDPKAVALTVVGQPPTFHAQVTVLNSDNALLLDRVDHASVLGESRLGARQSNQLTPPSRRRHGGTEQRKLCRAAIPAAQTAHLTGATLHTSLTDH